MLRNLLSNAVKFTETGGVELRIAPVPEPDVPAAVRGHGPVVAFSILDTGIGIAEQHLETIFGAFQQADGTTSRKYGGTGLGLSISREIAHLLGGAISATSTPGEGSTFTLHLPVAWFEPGDAGPQEPAASAASSAAAAAGRAAPDVRPAARRLLVVEDRPRGLLSLVTESAVAGLTEGRTATDPRGPVRIRTVTGPDEAAVALAGEPCHCVVLDLDMAGDAAVRILDALDGDPALRQVPVLAHHTRRLDPGRERLLRDSARAKPLELLPSLDELRERITLHLTAERLSDVLPLTTVQAVRAVQGPPGTLAGHTVLVIDDDARNVYALTGMLELHGVRVLHAGNGREGVDMLLGHPDVELILMDIMMPEMDGYAATVAIRAMPEHQDVPIIAVTAKAMEGDREKSLAAGANDYITKPVDIDALITCMHRWLSP